MIIPDICSRIFSGCPWTGTRVILGKSTIVGSGMPSFLTTRIQGVLDIPFSRPATTSVAELIAIAKLNPLVWTIFPLNSSKVPGPARGDPETTWWVGHECRSLGRVGGWYQRGTWARTTCPTTGPRRPQWSGAVCLTSSPGDSRACRQHLGEAWCGRCKRRRPTEEPPRGEAREEEPRRECRPITGCWCPSLSPPRSSKKRWSCLHLRPWYGLSKYSKDCADERSLDYCNSSGA